MLGLRRRTGRSRADDGPGSSNLTPEAPASKSESRYVPLTTLDQFHHFPRSGETLDRAFAYVHTTATLPPLKRDRPSSTVQPKNSEPEIVRHPEP